MTRAALSTFSPTLSRRLFVRGLGAGVAGLFATRAAGGLAAVAPLASGAAQGVAMLRDYYLDGTFPVAPWQAQPGPDWHAFGNGLLSYLVPPTWTATAPNAPSDPAHGLLDITATRVVAPDGTAGWEVYGALAPSGSSADDAAVLGVQCLLGTLPNSAYLDVERTVMEGAAVTFGVARQGATLAVVRGLYHPAPSSAPLVSYEVMAAPEATFTAVTRSVFLPLIYQELCRGGCSSGGGGNNNGNGTGGNGTDGNGGDGGNGNDIGN